MTDEILIEAAQRLGVDPVTTAAPLPSTRPPMPVGPSVAMTPMAMLATAVANGAGLEMIERLMTLQERWQANQARLAFNAALAAARAEIPPIVKNRRVHFKGKDGKADTDYRHEDLAGIAEVVDPILGRHGLSYRFRTDAQVDRPVVVTCVLSHRDGHSEENSLVGPRDVSGNKNALQQIASAVTYLSRYTLKAALGLSVAEVDDDGQAAAPSPIEVDATIARWTKALAEAPSVIDLQDIREKLRDLPPEVRRALVAPYRAAEARLAIPREERAVEADAPATGQPEGADVPLTAAEADALLSEARRRLAAVKAASEVDQLWDELVEPVKDRLANPDYAELLQGFDAARVQFN